MSKGVNYSTLIDRVISDLENYKTQKLWSNEWKTRLDAIVELQGLFQDDDFYEYQNFSECIDKLVPSINRQLTDLRSIVIKECCNLLNIMVEELGDSFDPIANQIMDNLLKLTLVTIKVISQSSTECVKNIIKNCQIHKGFGAILRQSSSKHKILKTKCYEFFLDVLVDQKEVVASNGKYVKGLKKKILSGVNDGVGEVRSFSRKCYWYFSRVAKKEAEEIFRSVDFSTQKNLKKEESKIKGFKNEVSPQKDGSNLTKKKKKKKDESKMNEDVSSGVNSARKKKKKKGTKKKKKKLDEDIDNVDIINDEKYPSEPKILEEKHPAGVVMSKTPPPQSTSTVQQKKKRKKIGSSSSRKKPGSSTGRRKKIKKTKKQQIEIFPPEDTPVSTKKKQTDSPKNNVHEEMTYEYMVKHSESSDWEIRKKFFINLRNYISSKTGKSFIGDENSVIFTRIVYLCLGKSDDTHYKVVVEVLKTIKKLIELYSVEFESFLEKTLKNLFLKLTDSKPAVRKEAQSVIIEISNNYEIGICLKSGIKLSMDNNPKVQMTALEYLFHHLGSSENAQKWIQVPNNMKKMILKMTKIIESNSIQKLDIQKVVWGILRSLNEQAAKLFLQQVNLLPANSRFVLSEFYDEFISEDEDEEESEESEKENNFTTNTNLTIKRIRNKEKLKRNDTFKEEFVEDEELELKKEISRNQSRRNFKILNGDLKNY